MPRPPLILKLALPLVLTLAVPAFNEVARFLFPERDFTSARSEALIVPLTTTSERKFALVMACPDCDLVWQTSDALTTPLALVSPANSLIRTLTSFVLVPLLTPNKVRVIVCTSVTSVRFTVTVLPSGLIIGGPARLPDLPGSGVTVAPLKVTADGNVNTTW